MLGGPLDAAAAVGPLAGMVLGGQSLAVLLYRDMRSCLDLDYAIDLASHRQQQL